MSSLPKFFTCTVFFIGAVVVVGPALAIAQNAPSSQNAPPAPVPAQLVTAKKVFISNMGTDPAFRAAMFYVQIDNPYNMFFAAMNGWGRFDLVSVPADADLVFEIRVAAPMTDCSSVGFVPEILLTVFDAKTHFVLWTFEAPVTNAHTKANIQKNVGLAMANLIDQVKHLTSLPGTAAQK